MSDQIIATKNVNLDTFSRLFPMIKTERRVMIRRLLMNKNQRDRQQVIQELRHRLRYANPLEREEIRRELNFWMYGR
jgi:hypothetical protein